MIFLLPIEPIEERYSIQWLKWFEREFKNKGLPWVTINPKPLTTEIESGEFLDVCGTNYYKAMQLAELARKIRRGDLIDGDIIFLHDLWFPGLEMIAYMRDALNLKIKIVGCLHAGTYCPTDFISQKGMGIWGEELENSWFKIVDKVFVGSNHHRNLVLGNRKISKCKIVNTGFPIYNEEPPFEEKENIVVFPHRLNPDRGPEHFDNLAKDFKNSGWKFVKTKEEAKTKKEYYELLRKAKIAVSFAKQETFGIAMREALFAGCLPLVPNSFCYPEFFPSLFRYSDYNQCRVFLIDMIRHYLGYEECRKEHMKRLLEWGKNAISNMLLELGL